MRIFNAMVNSIYGFCVEVIEVTRRKLSKNEKNYVFESALLNILYENSIINVICVMQVFDMLYLEAEIWIMVEFMRILYASNFFAEDMTSMLENFIKKKLIL